MDEFKPEDDLRPDSSDRPSSRSRKAAPGPRFAVSRQHLMIGIGILVLLLLIIGIGSALKAPTKHESAQQQGSQSGSARDINLSGSSSLTTTNNGVPGGTTDANDANGVNTTQPQQPQEISVPPISGTPTEAQPQPQQGGAQQRVDLPGNMKRRAVCTAGAGRCRHAGHDGQQLNAADGAGDGDGRSERAA
ncbi:Uncharacterized protein conserved in bacteria [Serratia rubidaea]|uniref:Uncharacterized protein conserved in bacteria n=1 Tax=Serratia rubidaea TaxID=61652 RepID=A0A4V6JIG8_SERRU|nr:Uncharacterized protein conserved in bacteria [Serratia rubidaea]